MSAYGFVSDTINGLFKMFFKFFFWLIAFVILLATLVVLATNWPFAIMLMVGILLSDLFYKWFSKRFNLDLPDYFSINIVDFMSTFHEGDEEIEAVRREMDYKMQQAREKVEMMHNALLSIEDQFKDIKTKRSLKNLFSKSPEEISPRMAKALEMELGKPKWSQYIDKVNENENGDWNEYKF